MGFIFSIGDIVHGENRQVGRQASRQVRAAASPDPVADCIARRSARSRAFTMQHARSARIPVAGKYIAIGRAERARKARKRRAQAGSWKLSMRNDTAKANNCLAIAIGGGKLRDGFLARGISLPSRIIPSGICNGIPNYTLRTMGLTVGREI